MMNMEGKARIPKSKTAIKIYPNTLNLKIVKSKIKKKFQMIKATVKNQVAIN